MGPGPEIAMLISAVVPLHSEPKGSLAKLRPSSTILPEKSASECGVRENPIHPLLLSVTRNVERQSTSE